MIPLRARLVAARHRDVVGRPLRSWRIGVGYALPAFFVGVVALIALLNALNPFESTAANIAFVVFAALLMGIPYLFMVDARIVVCERGVLMGRMVPGLPFSPTYVIRGREIDPRTVCVVSNAVTASNALGEGPIFFQYFTLHAETLGQPAVCFTGPWGHSVIANRQVRQHVPVSRSQFIFASRRATKIADALLHAIGRDGGIPEGFAPVNGLQPIQVTEAAEDSVRQIPGASRPR